jgi:hypothetical protein
MCTLGTTCPITASRWSAAYDRVPGAVAADADDALRVGQRFQHRAAPVQDRRIAAHEYPQRPSPGGRNAAAYRGVKNADAAGLRGSGKFPPGRGAAAVMSTHTAVEA